MTQNPQTSFTAPFEDNMETSLNDWSHSEYWALSGEHNHTSGGTLSWKYETGSPNGYDTGTPNSGHLTSPAISIPTQDVYFLRFWYRFETESPDIHWDQRWVQISVNGGEFTNLLQLSNDQYNYWLQSPAISLENYAGQTVRIRYYFATLDDVFNTFSGWYVDDFSINTNAPPNCSDEGDDFTQAQLIEYGSATNGTICPGGDLDFYKFHAIAGDKIGAHVAAQRIGSSLDTYLYLLDGDGHSILDENDDIQTGQQTDSWITYQFTRTGTYYLMLRAWDHPTSGGPNQTYTLHLVKDHQDPAARYIFPHDGGSIPDEPFYLNVEASDIGSGVSHVQFLWHSSDWYTSDWTSLGEDWDSQDGWSYIFDPGGLVLNDIAFYARVYDWAGNWIGTGAWYIGHTKIYFPMIIK
jgi:hypothetical protein